MVEDDQTIASMYRIRLHAAGWEVHVAGFGELGVELAQTLQPDVIVLDIMLPGIDGIEVLRRLRADERTRDARVIVLSNSAGLPTAADEARELGIVEWLVKSRVSPSELVERLRALDTEASE